MNNNEVPVDNNTIDDKSTVETSTIETPKVEKLTTQLSEPEEVKYEEVESKPTSSIKNGEVRTDSYFDGIVLDLLGWKLLSALVTIVTASIAYPWGKCMVISYIANHTVLNGKRLKFEGTGGDLFVQRLKWIFFTIITLGIYSLWIPVKEKDWQLSHIHFEDEPFVDGDSYFDGKFYQLYGVNLLSNILNTCSLGLLFPFTVCFKLRWLAKHSIINKKKVVFDGTPLSLFGHYLLWGFLSIITLGIYSFWLEVNVQKWQVSNSHIKTKDEVEIKSKSLPILITICIIIIIALVSVIPSFVNLIKGDIKEESDLLEIIDKSRAEAFERYKSGEFIIGEDIDVNTLQEFKQSKYDITGYFYIYSFHKNLQEDNGLDFSAEDIIYKFETKNYECFSHSYSSVCEYIYLEKLKESIDNNFSRVRPIGNVLNN